MLTASKTFVGLDASLRSTGVVVLRDGKIPLVSLIAPPKKLGEYSLSYIYDNFNSLLKLIGPVDMAVIEGPSFNSQNRPFDMGAAYGVYKLALMQHQVPYVIISPTSLKRYFTGNGAATKQHMLARAQLEEFESAQNDIVDAYALACLARDSYYGQAGLRVRHREEIVQQALALLVTPPSAVSQTGRTRQPQQPA